MKMHKNGSTQYLANLLEGNRNIKIAKFKDRRYKDTPHI